MQTFNDTKRLALDKNNEILYLEKKHSDGKFGTGDSLISDEKRFKVLDMKTGEKLNVKFRCSKHSAHLSVSGCLRLISQFGFFSYIPCRWRRTRNP